MVTLRSSRFFSSGIIDIKKRIILTVILTILLFTVLYISSMMPFSSEELDSLLKQAEEILKKNFTILDIFLNNFTVSLLIFIPVVGPIVGGYAIYVTGRIMGALATSTGIPSILLISIAIITFYGLVEFLAYGTAFTESIIFSYSIFKREIKREYRWVLISLIVTALLLLVAATIEYLLIQFFGQLYPEPDKIIAKI